MREIVWFAWRGVMPRVGENAYATTEIGVVSNEGEHLVGVVTHVTTPRGLVVVETEAAGLAFARAKQIVDAHYPGGRGAVIDEQPGDLPTSKHFVSDFGAARLCDKGLGADGVAEALKRPWHLKVHLTIDDLKPHLEKMIDAKVAELRAADDVFLNVVDQLLRYCQGLTDRDPLRDRLCRELAPLLRECMGRKDG